MMKRAAFPAVPLFQHSTGRAAVTQLLWGDFVRITGPERDDLAHPEAPLPPI